MKQAYLRRSQVSRLNTSKCWYPSEILQGVIRMKCAGQNNFHMNHFKSSIISGLCWPSHNWFGCTFWAGPSTSKWQRIYLWWWFRRSRHSSSWSSPGMSLVQPAPTSPLGKEKVHWGNIWQKGRLVDCLFVFATDEIPEWNRGIVCVFILTQNQSWESNMGLFSLKIGWDLAYAFRCSLHWRFDHRTLLNSGSERNHDISGSFCHFGYFFVFYSFEEGIYLAVWHFLILRGIPPADDFISRWFLQTWLVRWPIFTPPS